MSSSVVRVTRRPALWLACSLLAAACKDAADPAAQTRPSEARAVEVARAVPTTHARSLTLSGTLTPLERVQVAARVEGPITDVRAELGDVVARDQVLAAIRPVDYKARAAELEATLAQAQSDVKRVQGLGDAGTAEELEMARTRLAEARAQRTLASRQLGDTTVRAPFAGSISARHVAPGTYVKPGTALFDLVAVDRLRLTLEVPERYAALVTVGTPVTIGARELVQPGAAGPQGQVAKDMAAGPGAPAAVSMAAGPGAQVRAEVTRVSPVVSPSTRTFTVEAVFSPAGSVLKPGMFIAAVLGLGQARDAVRVPRAAVFHVLGHDRVMRVVDGVAEPVDVELVGEEGGAAIISGLPADSQVIARGAALVAPGTAVAPQPIAGETAARPTGATP